MRLTLEAILVLDAIDRRGSFAAAAEELHRVPSAITYTVQRLEQDLDVVLFDRSRHRAQLTPAGKMLLRDGRHLLRAAEDIERRAKRAATGWEAELRIAVSDLLTIRSLLPLVAQFYKEECGTRIKLLTEVYGGVWDALASDRADLVIGATGEGPLGGGYAAREFGEIEFVFVLPAGHPLTNYPEPIKSEDIYYHRAVAAADSSRYLPPRTASLLSGQDVLTVPDMATKCEAHRRGLGVGYVPRYMVERDVTEGKLVIKQTESGAPKPQLLIAWASTSPGKALNWFLTQLSAPDFLRTLLSSE